MRDSTDQAPGRIPLVHLSRAALWLVWWAARALALAATLALPLLIVEAFDGAPVFATPAGRLQAVLIGGAFFALLQPLLDRQPPDWWRGTGSGLRLGLRRRRPG